MVILNKTAGLSHAKVAAVMTQLLHIPVTRGASAQIIVRAARRLEPAYREILQHVPRQVWLSVDETGWRVGGHPAWLHVWVGGQVTAYAIDSRRSADRLEQVIGIHWTGKLVHDGWASYDRFLFAQHQHCQAHILCRAHELEKQAHGRGRAFPREVINLFQESLATRDQFAAFEVSASKREQAYAYYVDQVLAFEKRRLSGGNATLANHLYIYAERWFTFLQTPTTPATNWPAEQALRPAVVNRKVWGGNRTPVGSHAQEVTMSVLATCRQQMQNALLYVSQALRGMAGSLFASAEGANQ